MSILRRRHFKRRKKGLSNGKKRILIINSTLVFFFFIGMGYSVLGTDLNILGTVTTKKYVAPTLYNVMKSYAEEGVYAKEYTGEHQDSMVGVGDKKIYHFYGSNDTNAIAILDKNNVIFANHCWQMIRTTDTGGVKMIYNGEAENGQCLNTRSNHVGYASLTTQSLNTTYYYGTSYEYDKTNNVFSLSGTVTTGTINTGEYTCKATTADGTCATLYLVDNLKSGTTYNVIPLNGNSHYSQFGTLQFNQQYTSPADVGYMYNTVYPVNEKKHIFYIQSSSMMVNTSYYYSDTIDYGNTVANQYTLTNPQLISSISNNEDLVGKYILSNGGNTSSVEAMYIVGISGTTLYYRRLMSGDLNITMQVGDSYTDNGDGTYTLDNATNLSYIDWYSGAYSSNKTKYVCDGVSATCTNLKHIANSTSKNYYYYWGVEHKYKYSESVSLSGSAYTLTGDIQEVWDMPNTTEHSKISTHHYTCFTTGTTCSKVYYTSRITTSVNYANVYVELTDVEDIETALTNMLSKDDVNAINSTIKSGVDAWYKKYLLNYSEKLEDTIFCNDRSIKSLGGWDPNGGSISTGYLQFKNHTLNSDLSCTNETDKFSLSNNKAQLTYPVGLMTLPEMYILNTDKTRISEKEYWLFSPDSFDNYAVERLIYSSGIIILGSVNQDKGVRPAVSLKPGTVYSDGEGSMANPYVVE